MKISDHPQFKLIKHYVTFYANQYSEIANSLTPLTALSHLVQNKNLLETEQEALLDRFDRQSEIWLTKEVYNYRGKLFDQIEKKLFSKSEFPTSIEIDEAIIEKFMELIVPYFREDFKGANQMRSLFGFYIKYRIRSAQYLSCQQIVESVLNLGYPNELNLTIEKIDDISEQISKPKIGRPPEVPDTVVKDIITDSLERAKDGEKNYSKFIKKNGTPNIRQLAIYIADNGYGTDLELRSLQRTVKRVIEHYDIINSVMS